MPDEPLKATRLGTPLPDGAIVSIAVLTDEEVERIAERVADILIARLDDRNG